ncbi:MAG: hypothetical protein A2934_01065 [Candidatus Sungbacteria bacterium RIFCSPLOWO2_01_FULL_47_10]|uniref:Uncharacterized protein n=1 Tax=Candidatus Sungbacteria bacterium RIFCSPLOWO2_01_FULL_47_10 TaxID=1802276 RepID=A0A1G2L4P4_9BACT|nr:MAG: hypothetical protein A2934_01065 [Candidatus Sungbacteria bacterium RIFCSPLOWO2_01_FULL_47_10]
MEAPEKTEVSGKGIRLVMYFPPRSCYNDGVISKTSLLGIILIIALTIGGVVFYVVFMTSVRSDLQAAEIERKAVNNVHEDLIKKTKEPEFIMMKNEMKDALEKKSALESEKTSMELHYNEIADSLEKLLSQKQALEIELESLTDISLPQ